MFLAGGAEAISGKTLLKLLILSGMAKTRTSFAKGKTGNPGGRPKGAFEARDLARKHTKAAIDRLFRIMQNGTSEQAQIGAAVALLDRGFRRCTVDL